MKSAEPKASLRLAHIWMGAIESGMFIVDFLCRWDANALKSKRNMFRIKNEYKIKFE